MATWQYAVLGFVTVFLLVNLLSESFRQVIVLSGYTYNDVQPLESTLQLSRSLAKTISNPANNTALNSLSSFSFDTTLFYNAENDTSKKSISQDGNAPQQVTSPNNTNATINTITFREDTAILVNFLWQCYKRESHAAMPQIGTGSHRHYYRFATKFRRTCQTRSARASYRYYTTPRRLGRFASKRCSLTT